MLPADLEELTKWQSSPDGEAFGSIYEIDRALTALELMTGSRAGLHSVREHFGELARTERRLQNLLDRIRPRALQAAE